MMNDYEFYFNCLKSFTRPREWFFVRRAPSSDFLSPNMCLPPMGYEYRFVYDADGSIEIHGRELRDI